MRRQEEERRRQEIMMRQQQEQEMRRRQMEGNRRPNIGGPNEDFDVRYLTKKYTCHFET